jgi:hypothetical protein
MIGEELEDMVLTKKVLVVLMVVREWDYLTGESCDVYPEM